LQTLCWYFHFCDLSKTKKSDRQINLSRYNRLIGV